MGANLSEFLFAQLLLLLVTAVLALVGVMLKRHVNSTDRVAEEVGKLSNQVSRLLERDRMHRLADYRKGSEENDRSDHHD